MGLLPTLSIGKREVIENRPKEGGRRKDEGAEKTFRYLKKKTPIAILFRNVISSMAQGERVHGRSEKKLIAPSQKKKTPKQTLGLPF